MAGNPVETFGRETGHNPNAFWVSTAKPLFNKVMAGTGQTFDNIGWEDLVGENSIKLMSEFTNRCKQNPPVSDHTKSPFSADTLKKVLLETIRQFQTKFANQAVNQPELFPDSYVSQWKNRLRDDRNRVLMQGEDEGNLKY